MTSINLASSINFSRFCFTNLFLIFETAFLISLGPHVSSVAGVLHIIKTDSHPSGAKVLSVLVGQFI